MMVMLDGNFGVQYAGVTKKIRATTAVTERRTNELKRTRPRSTQS